jgi:DeoR family fructose operon transcriptional repressor
VLPPDRRLYVATNSVPIAARLSASSGITLHLLGGRVRGITQTAVGHSTIRAMDDLRVDVVFLGTNGISPGYGFSTPDEAEAATKRAMTRAAQRVIVLADSSKLGREHMVRFAAVEDVDVLVTDADAEPEIISDLEKAGIEVVLA